MRAYLLSIGDELASGLTTNTNSAWLAHRLTSLGIRVTAHLTVGDDLPRIVSAIKNALDLLKQDDGIHTGKTPGKTLGTLIISGGLGPTEDDLTRQALAAALDEQLVEDPDAVLQIENWFNARNRTMSPSNRTQALRPSSATCIENTAGTAPGLSARKSDVDIYVMPGVPREMKEMFTRSILPKLLPNTGNNVTLMTTLHTFGLGESFVGEKIKDLMTRGANPSVGTTVNDGIVSVRIYATGTPDDALQMTTQTKLLLHQRLAPILFGEESQTLEATVARLLTQSRYTVATAESCTGGLLAKLLTDIPGSSTYFPRGWITYSNQAKHEDLSVPPELIEQHGAVSEQVALAMAEGARKFAQTDFALAITGIAGPDGGTESKPVGTVYIALASPDPGHPPTTPTPPPATTAHKFIFPGPIEVVRQRAALMALALLRWKLLGIDPPL
jgi:nicotinamide-nucleotide amidase